MQADLLCPHPQYRRQFTPKNLAFSTNLQEFVQQVNLVAGLETGGKLSPQAAHEQIEALWGKLYRSKEQLGIE